MVKTLQKRGELFLLAKLHEAEDQDAFVESRPVLKLVVDIVRVTGR
jgi:hypothetical protein